MDRKAYIRLKKDLRANAGHYSDEEVVALVTKLISYALTNITEKETVCQGYDYQYEDEICDIGLSLDAFFQKNTQAKSSHRLRELILQVIDNEAYRNGRDSFIYLLYRLKMDDELRRLATERPAFWKTPRLQFQLLYALYRRHIRGFEREAERLFNDYPRGDIHQYAKKYLDKMSRLALSDKAAPKAVSDGRGGQDDC